jgi:Protein of unknown function, DUF547
MLFPGLLLVLLLGPSTMEIDHTVFTTVLQDHVRRGKVDYPALKKDERFDRYLEMLAKTDPAAIRDRKDRLAFWINAYNAFTIRLINDHYPVKSIRDIEKGGKGPWDIEWITINDSTYSLNEIEHEIIRKKFDEPLIHMALVCAAISCPPLRSEAYTGKKLEAQLRDNAKAFFSDPGKNHYDAQSGTLYMSELLNWYGDDFNGRYGSAKQFALKELGVPNAQPKKVEFLPYDWSLNAQ